MIALHYFPGNASLIVHIVLRELGVPFELRLVDREHGAHKSAAYLKLNPNGLIPVLEDGPLVLYETGAICLHLSDSHPQARLAPALGTPDRAQLYKWLFWMADTLQPVLIAYFYPDRLVAPGNAASAAEVRAQAQSRAGVLLDQLDAQLAAHGQPWLLGAHFTLLDPYAFVLCRWTRGFSGPASTPARERPHLKPYLERLLSRPAVQQALAAEQLSEPWV